MNKLVNLLFASLIFCATLFLSNTSFAQNIGQSEDSENIKQEISAQDVLKLEPESMAQRQLQTRKYNTASEDKIMTACVNLLQDSGFNIDNTEAKLGLILGSKAREAMESGQVAGAIIVAVIFGVNVPIDKHQKMFASIVISPAPSEKKATLVRVTFSRLVWNTHNAVSKAERLEMPEMYQTFFEKLSKSLFLEAQNI
jgi:hypothetical protein